MRADRLLAILLLLQNRGRMSADQLSKELEVFDYDQENYTPSLWFSEGTTSYYDILIPLWAGIYETKTFLEIFSKEITRYLLTPGRKVQPVSESHPSVVHAFKSSQSLFV